MSNIKFCQNCRDKNKQDIFNSGYYSWLQDDCYECPANGCGHKLIDINLSKEDFNLIISISTDIDFLELMIYLKENDLIEYEVKLNQFKTQLQQQESIKAQNDTTPKCPHCKSTNIRPISGLNRGVSIAVWGIFSKKINKSFECLNCNYTW